LKAIGFKPLPFEYQSWFQSAPLKFNLRRYTPEQFLEVLQDFGVIDDA
jgi:hypothetical protein